MKPSSILHPRKIHQYYRTIWLKHDLPAGLTVFLVALPLCLGISLASGAPLYAGIFSGVIGGVLVSLVSGSQLGVSGPAAGLTTVVAASIAGLGDYHLFALTVFTAGMFQLLFGVFRLGTVANYFPSSVIRGMLAAIGLILISKQIPLALGYDHPDFWTACFAELFRIGRLDLKGADAGFLSALPVLVISVVSLSILGLLGGFFKRHVRWLPLPLLVVLTGIGLVTIYPWIDPAWALRETQIVRIPQQIFSAITGPDFSGWHSRPEVWRGAFTIALLASLETLLCVEAIDKLDPLKRKTPVNRELIAQGVGNMTCGLVGALPMTAVIVRGAANVDAGGRTRLSSFTHGVFLLLAVLTIPFVLNKIPFASLSAILIVTGYNLTRPALYRKMYRLGWNQFLPFLITVVVILATDLLEGVAIGLGISIYFLVRNNFKAEYKIHQQRISETEHFYIKLNSMVTFLNKVNLRATLDKIPPYSVLTIDASDSRFVDYDVLEMISEFEKQAHQKHIQLILKNIELVEVSGAH